MFGLHKSQLLFHNMLCTHLSELSLSVRPRKAALSAAAGAELPGMSFASLKSEKIIIPMSKCEKK